MDGFDIGCDWFCSKMNDKKIVGFVERPSEWDRISIPEWCPLGGESK